MATPSLFKRHAVLSYFVLTFALSWGGILLVLGSTGIPGAPEHFDALFPSVYLAMLVGPCVTGVLLTFIVGGRAGARDFLARLLKWRVGARWYLVAIFTAPALVAITLAALSTASNAFVPGIFRAPSKMSALLFGLGVGLGAGIFEELGWTGFAVPRMKPRQALLSTGLLVGVLWGAWHFLAVYWGSASSAGSVSVPVFLTAALFTFLPPYRILMVWVYARTESLLVAMIMHASLTSTMLILGPMALSGTSAVIYDTCFGAFLWLAVAALMFVTRGRMPKTSDFRKAA